MTKKIHRIVTKESLIALINDPNPAKTEHVIGRALVALMKRQTRDEISSNTTNKTNSVGFNSADARSGTIGAKYYLKHRKMQRWMVEEWIKPVRGTPRIAKYWKQLDAEAHIKASQPKQRNFGY